MIADVVRVASFLVIQRTRKLPFPGRVLVRVGENVHPEDLIAEGSIHGEVTVLDIANGLGVSPSLADDLLVREIGENLKEGDLIAQSEGALPRLIRMPFEGQLVACHQGKAILTAGSISTQIRAGMIGVVETVIPEFGAVLTAKGSLIQGVWGNGRTGAGIIDVIEPSLSTPLEGSMLEDLESGHMVAAGMCLSAEVLLGLADKGITGLIMGTLAPELVSIARNLTIPVIVLQGFGALTVDATPFSLIQSRQGEIASINACETDIFMGERPEIFIPQLEGQPESAVGFRAKLAPGQRVRVTSGEAIGQSGLLVELSKETVLFESGLAMQAATIRVDNGEQIQVPSQNLVIVNS